MANPAPLPPIAAAGRRHYVTMGDGRRVPLGAYAAAWRRVLAADPGQLFNGAPSDWFGIPEPAAVILRQFRAGMHARINRHDPEFGIGRKWSTDWQSEAWRTARVVNTPRLRVGWIPVEFRGRLADRLDY
jgi:hypothetical protein